MSRYFAGYKKISNLETQVEQAEKYVGSKTEQYEKKRNFLIELVNYLISKVISVVKYSYYLILSGYNLLVSLKEFLVKNLFWGRSKLYKIGTQLVIGIVTVLVGLTGVLGQITQETKAQSLSRNFSATADLLNVTNNLNSLSGSDNPIPNIIPSVTIKVEANDNIDSVTKRFLEKDIEFAKNSGYELKTDEDMFKRKKNMVQYLNNLKGDNPSLKIDQELNCFLFDGIIHEIKDGDNLDKLADKYKIDKQIILDTNLVYFDSEADIKVGSKVIIPKAVVEAPKPDPIIIKPIINYTNNSVQVNTVQASQYASGVFGNPINPGCPYGISQYFSSYHNGIDLASGDSASGKCSILASDGGIVEWVGWDSAGGGNGIRINHGNGFKTWYLHLKDQYVSAGQIVTKGQAIGYMGRTGGSAVTGVHLHFIVDRGGWVNPLNYVNL